MRNLRSSVFNRVRVVLALSIAVANVSLFAVSSPAAPRSCIACVLLEGGALGQYVKCRADDDGPMSTCTPGLFECYGYECEWGEAVTESQIEAIPAQFTGRSN